MRDDPYWTSRENSVEMIELSSINKVSLVWVSSYSNIGSMRYDYYWTSRESTLELVEQVSFPEPFSPELSIKFAHGRLAVGTRMRKLSNIKN